MKRTLRSALFTAGILLLPALPGDGTLAQEAPRPAHPAQRIPGAPDFPTGPAIGERLPDFRLPNQRGELIDFHADRADRKAAVLFQRSAVW